MYLPLYLMVYSPFCIYSLYVLYNVHTHIYICVYVHVHIHIYVSSKNMCNIGFMFAFLTCYTWTFDFNISNSDNPLCSSSIIQIFNKSSIMHVLLLWYNSIDLKLPHTNLMWIKLLQSLHWWYSNHISSEKQRLCNISFALLYKFYTSISSNRTY